MVYYTETILQISFLLSGILDMLLLLYILFLSKKIKAIEQKLKTD